MCSGLVRCQALGDQFAEDHRDSSDQERRCRSRSGRAYGASHPATRQQPAGDRQRRSTRRRTAGQQADQGDADLHRRQQVSGCSARPAPCARRGWSSAICLRRSLREVISAISDIAKKALSRIRTRTISSSSTRAGPCGDRARQSWRAGRVGGACRRGRWVVVHRCAPGRGRDHSSRPWPAAGPAPGRPSRGRGRTRCHRNRHNSRPVATTSVTDEAPRMFSLQTIFGQGKQFYALLDEAAVAAHDSTKALHEMLKAPERTPGAGRLQAGPPARARGLGQDQPGAGRQLHHPDRARGHRGAGLGAVQDPQAGREVRRPLRAGAAPPGRHRFRPARGDAGAGRRRGRGDGPRAAQHEAGADEGSSTTACARSRPRPTG